MADSMSDLAGQVETRDQRSYPSRPFLAVSVAVFRDGKVLIAERLKPPAVGIFALPGGMVEPGERLEIAALRELREEVGVEAEIIGFTRHIEVIERDTAGALQFHAVVCPFAAKWVAGEPHSSAEAGRVAFVDPADLSHYPTTPGLAHIIALARDLVGCAP